LAAYTSIHHHQLISKQASKQTQIKKKAKKVEEEKK